MSQRGAQQLLTFIPEQDRAVAYRYNILCIGPKVKNFCQMVVSSEIAEAYMPRGSTLSVQPPAEGDDGGGDMEDTEGIQLEEKDDDDGDDMPKKKKTARQLILFAPTGGATSTELVRMRFFPLENDKIDLPQASDAGTAMISIILFVFWDVTKKGYGAKNAIKVFDLRMMELLKQKEALRPHVALVAFGATPEQDAELKKFTKRYQAKGKIIAHYVEDCGEDSIIGTIQEVVDSLIGAGKEGGGGEAKQEKTCCEIL